MKMISIAKDYSRFPAGRFRKDARYSGEAFRDDVLIPALLSGQPVVVNLDGTRGFGSSFLEEAFGGLVRSNRFAPHDLARLTLESNDDPSIVYEIEEYIRDAWALQNHKDMVH